MNAPIIPLTDEQLTQVAGGMGAGGGGSGTYPNPNPAPSGPMPGGGVLGVRG